MKKGPKYAIFVVVAIVVLLIVFAVYSKVTVSKNPAQGVEIAAGKKTGIFDANETYAYHAGTNTINIDVGINQGIISNISVVAVNQVDPISAHYIEAVNAALPSLVVGKPLSKVSLPKQISGSSLTTTTVNSYLQSLD